MNMNLDGQAAARRVPLYDGLGVTFPSSIAQQSRTAAFL